MHNFAPAALALALCAGQALAAKPQIDPARITAHVKVLASDAYEGRAPATRAETKTVKYLTDQFREAGLQPGGDLRGSSRAWTQDVPLARFQTKGPVSLGVTAVGVAQVWTQGDQVAIRAAQTGAERISIKDAPLMFVGYGVTAPERDWDDFKGVDLKGKIALVLVNDPDFETGEGPFGGKAMTYYGRWMYKYEEAARRGALGMLVIHETVPAAYGWVTVKNSNTIEVLDIIRDRPTEAHVPLEGWIQRDVTVDLFRKAGLDFEALKLQARGRDFRPVTLSGVTLSADFAVDVEKIVTRNVVAVLPGAKRPDERVIYTSHWDHLGIGPPDAKGDVIYNGAVDNADGIAVLIELGRAFAQAPRTDRSVVFLAVTAEEKGLLGSEYYAANPLYPLATTVANLNLDALRPAGPARDFSTAGDAPVTLQDDLIAVAKLKDRYFTPDPRPEAGHFYRSDHFPFAKRGVPAISYGSGQDLVAGGTAAGKAFAEAYVKDRYHQPADEIGPDWNSDGIAQDTGLLYDLGRALANSTAWPEWKPGAEFKAERDRTATERR